MSTTDLAQQVADLTTATTALTQEVVGQKARLTAAADTATTKASEASGSASTASTKALESVNAANQSKIYRDEASEIAGLDTVEEAVTLALNERKLGAQTESDMKVSRALMDIEMAASGFIHYGQQYERSGYAATPVNEGLYVAEHSAYANALALGKNGETYAGGTSKTLNPVVNIAGFNVTLKELNQSSVYGSYQPENIVKFDDAPDGTVTYDSATGTRTQHANAAAAFAAETATNKVVINRVDLFGLEGYLEKVEVGGYVYPYGCIQSQATIVDGVATTVDNTRPITYFAVYDGDTTSRGRGWLWDNLTDAQKATLLSNPEHNLYAMDDGDLVQFRIRQRTISGAGNGNFETTDPNGTSPLLGYQRLYNGLTYVQGHMDTPAANQPSTWVDGQYRGNVYHNDVAPTGVFKGSNSDGSTYTAGAYNGECYWLTLGTAERLNKGAFHPSLNEMGCRTLNSSDSSAGGRFWYQSGVISPATTAQCFNLITSPATDNTNAGAVVSTGYIGTLNGRDDGRFYDAIYAGGQGGVTDLRLSSYPMDSKEEAAKVFSKVVNGSYRGKEDVTYTQIVDVGIADSSSIANGRRVLNYLTFDAGLKYVGTEAVSVSGYIVDKATGNTRRIQIAAQTANLVIHLEGDTAWALDSYIVVTQETDYSVSGEYTHVDVVGKVEVILSNDDFSNGWLGTWVPFNIANGANTFPITRKSLSANVDNKFFSGGNWSQSTAPVNTTRNEITLVYTDVDSEFSAYSYTAFAKQTVESTNKPVLNGSEGLGDVWVYNGNSLATWGNLLQESLLGKVGVNTSSNVLREQIKLENVCIHTDLGLNSNTTNPTTHNALRTAAPTNDSPAVKALWYQTSDNGQVSMNFAYNELVYGSNAYSNNPIDSSTSTVLVAGRVYHCTAGKHAGLAFKCDSNITLTLDSYYIGIDGSVIQTDGLVLSSVRLSKGASDRWGDDSTVRIIDGQGTYNNLNDDTCLYGTNELALPIGWSKNRARIGTQVEGVDL